MISPLLNRRFSQQGQLYRRQQVGGTLQGENLISNVPHEGVRRRQQKTGLMMDTPVEEWVTTVLPPDGVDISRARLFVTERGVRYYIAEQWEDGELADMATVLILKERHTDGS